MVVISANTKPTGIRSTARSGKTNTQLEPVSSNQYGDSVSHPPITAPQAMEIMEKKLRFFFSLFGVSDIILSSLRHVVFNRFSVGNAVSKSKGRENFVSIYNMAVDVI